MAKRELSSLLKNLKFMQRAIQKEEDKAKIEEVKDVTVTAEDLPSASSVVKRCVVIVEGDPLPGATRGRMSFLSFNPSIDKLNGEESDLNETETAATISGRQNGTSVRENGSDDAELDGSSSDGSVERKRKQAEVVSAEAQYPNKSLKACSEDQHSSPNNRRSSQKKHKREKLDWSVLRPPKHHNKRK